MIQSFLSGLLTGGVVVWLYRHRIEQAAQAWTEPVRRRAADGVGFAIDGLEVVRDSLEGRSAA